MALKVYSLFSGVGGFDLGLERAGMQIVGQAENDQFATRVLRHHWPNMELVGDVRDVGDVDADVIVGGFPCQDISVSGKMKGLDGARSGLWWEFYRILDDCQRVRPYPRRAQDAGSTLASPRAAEVGLPAGRSVDGWDGPAAARTQRASEGRW